MNKLIIFLLCILCLFGNASANVEMVSEVMHFWDEPNIPALYTTVSNETRMSYNATTDIYTMHFSFYQNVTTDTFNFNETVYLESNNDGAPSYFRWDGHTDFDDFALIGWDTVNDEPAPQSDATRAHVFCDTGGTYNISNGNMSYLGYGTQVHQSGVNLYFTDNGIINNVTFLHNEVGLYMSTTDNFTFTNNTVAFSEENGLHLTDVTNSNFSTNEVYSNGDHGIYGFGIGAVSFSSNNFTENTVYSNTKNGMYFIQCINNYFTNNNMEDEDAIYVDIAFTGDSTGNIVIDDVKTSDHYGFGVDAGYVSFQTDIVYNVTLSEFSIFTDNAPLLTQLINLEVVSGKIGQLNVSSLSSNIVHQLNYINNTIIETQTSDANGSLVFTSDLTVGTYIIREFNHNNLSFYGETINPTEVREGSPFTVSINIADFDGIISSAYVTISGDDYRMTAGAGKSWSYVFTATSLPTEYYVTDFYATDNAGDLNSTTSNMTILVTSSSGTGSDGDDDPEPTAEPTAEPDPSGGAPSGGIISNGETYDIDIGETHITIPDFFESPLWEIAIFMIGSLLFVGIICEVGGKK